jgi:hypothetical protein
VVEQAGKVERELSITGYVWFNLATLEIGWLKNSGGGGRVYEFANCASNW